MSLVTVVAGVLSGCASIESTRVDSSHSGDGLLYFLPKRDIEVSVTVGDKKTLTLAAAASTAMPDFEHAFVAQVPRSAIGNVKGSVQINAQGLLHSESSSQITSSLTAVLQGAAGLAGGLQPFSELPPEPSQDCSIGTHSKIIKMSSRDGTWVDPGSITFCGITFSVAAPTSLTGPASSALVPKATDQVASAGERRAGLFYRLAIPYVVTAKGTNESREFMVFSPTGSRTYFLPVAAAAFGSNDASFTFDSGVPTKYGQTIQSEVVGLIGLPATLLQSYFKAIGDMFGSRKGSTENEKAYLEALNALSLARMKQQACSSAVAANDSARIAVDCK